MWAQMAAAAVGIWLMASPSVLDLESHAETNNLIAGPLVVSFGVIAIWQIGRELRWLNLAVGVWLLIAPWILGFETEGIINSLLAGALLIGLSLIKGSTSNQYGGGWKSLLNGDERQG